MVPRQCRHFLPCRRLLHHFYRHRQPRSYLHRPHLQCHQSHQNLQNHRIPYFRFHHLHRRHPRCYPFLPHLDRQIPCPHLHRRYEVL